MTSMSNSEAISHHKLKWLYLPRVIPVFLYIRDVGIGCDGVISFYCEAQVPYSSLSKDNCYVNVCVACLSLFPWPGNYPLATVSYEGL